MRAVLPILILIMASNYAIAEEASDTEKDYPWRLGVGVIAQQQIYSDYEQSNFPLLQRNDTAQVLMVPIIGYQGDNWSVGTDGANYSWEFEPQTVSISADFTKVGINYDYSLTSWLNVGPGAAITYGDGLGWQMSANSTLLSVNYGQLFSDSDAYKVNASTGAPLWLKEGQPSFLLTAGATVQSKAYTIAATDPELDALALQAEQRTLNLGLVHFWQLTDQLSYVIVADHAWLASDLAKQAVSDTQLSLISFVTYNF